MLNPRLSIMPDYPFDQLRSLLDPIDPPAGIIPLSLSIGEPKHQPPAMVTEALNGDPALWGKYPPGDGTPEFRAAVAGWLTRRYGLTQGAINPDDQILPVVGTREALYLVSTLCVPEQKSARQPIIAMPNPFYHVYGGATVVSGAQPLYLSADASNGFIPDISTLPPETLESLALYYLCSPANPQGESASLETLKTAITLARRYDFVLAVDECYAEIYHNQPPVGALQACAALGQGFDNVLVFHSLSKRSSVPGLRSGFVAGDVNLIQAFRRLRNYIGPTMPLPIMQASTALWNDDTHVEENRALYRAKFDVADQLLRGKYGYYRPTGGFFLWLDVGDGEKAAAKLWTEAALRTLPGAYIARTDASGTNPGQPYLRVALVHDTQTTREALERLVGVLG